MKILQIASKFPYPATDGGKLSAYGVTKYLAKLGHSIDFVAYLNNESPNSFLSQMSKICVPYIIDKKTNNSIIGALRNVFSSVPYNISKYYSKELQKFLKEYFDKNRPEIVHITTLHMSWCVDEIKKHTNAPIILRQENLEMEIMRRYSEREKNLFLKYYSKWQYKKLFRYEPLMCEKFDCCVMISTKDKALLEEFNIEVNIKSIPVGVESCLLDKKHIEKEKYSLAHIGTMDWFPNYDSLTWFINQVLPEIILKYPTLKLYVYGGGKLQIEIPLKVKNHVIIKGYVKDLWQELLSKNLAIVPLRIGSGIRVKILEMLAVGQNIISTNIGIEGIDVKDGEHLIIANEKDEFVKKIVSFIEKKEDYDNMINNGKNLIRNDYTWEIIADKFDILFKELLIKKGNT